MTKFVFHCGLQRARQCAPADGEAPSGRREPPPAAPSPFPSEVADSPPPWPARPGPARTPPLRGSRQSLAEPRRVHDMWEVPGSRPHLDGRVRRDVADPGGGIRRRLGTEDQQVGHLGGGDRCERHLPAGIDPPEVAEDRLPDVARVGQPVQQDERRPPVRAASPAGAAPVSPRPETAAVPRSDTATTTTLALVNIDAPRNPGSVNFGLESALFADFTVRLSSDLTPVDGGVADLRTFLNGTQIDLCSNVPISANGIGGCRLTDQQLPPGSYQVTAHYEGVLGRFTHARRRLQRRGDLCRCADRRDIHRQPGAGTGHLVAVADSDRR
jgi:hypothetical protein